MRKKKKKKRKKKNREKIVRIVRMPMMRESAMLYIHTRKRIHRETRGLKAYRNHHG